MIYEEIKDVREADFRLDTMQGRQCGAWLLRSTQISLTEEA